MDNQQIIDALKIISKAADTDVYTIISALEYGNAIDPDTEDEWLSLLDS